MPVVDAPSIARTYSEQHDGTNDCDHGGIEETGLRIVVDDTSVLISGYIHTGAAHYDTTYGTIDVDNFGITVDQDADVAASLTGSGLVAIPSISFEAYSDQTQVIVGSDTWSPTSTGVSVHALAGSYEIGVAAFGSAESPIVSGPPIAYSIVFSRQ